MWNIRLVFFYFFFILGDILVSLKSVLLFCGLSCWLNCEKQKLFLRICRLINNTVFHWPSLTKPPTLNLPLTSQRTNRRITNVWIDLLFCWELLQMSHISISVGCISPNFQTVALTQMEVWSFVPQHFVLVTIFSHLIPSFEDIYHVMSHGLQTGLCRCATGRFWRANAFFRRQWESFFNKALVREERSFVVASCAELLCNWSRAF